MLKPFRDKGRQEINGKGVTVTDYGEIIKGQFFALEGLPFYV